MLALDWTLLLFGAACASICAVSAAPAGAKISSLPGLQQMPPYPMYSGYVNVDEKAGRNLFYWLVTAESDSANTPLVLWLTGGPGCSSLYALTSEHGFAFPSENDPSTLVLNPYSWNKVTNIIYLEAPSGVGFSYTENGNYTTGDNDVAVDNYNFLAGFISQYPEYSSRPFYIAGESYGGHYVPQLALLLSQKAIKGLNFVGFSVGNPSFDGFYDGNNKWPFMASHGLTSSAQYAAAFAACNGSFVGAKTAACNTILTQMQQLFIGLDPYNIYSPCNGPPSLDGGCLTTEILAQKAADYAQTTQHNDRNLAQTVVPCTNVSGPVYYFNQAAVRAALHVVSSSAAWDVCSTAVNYTQYAASVRDIYTQLRDQLHILVYSGDVDSCVPYLGTEAAVDSLQFPVLVPYQKWTVNDTNGVPQIAGYFKTYQTKKTFYYATVKGAGHMVPTFKPAEALALFSRFISGKPPAD